MNVCDDDTVAIFLAPEATNADGDGADVGEVEENAIAGGGSASICQAGED
eukprot:COSAG04_NODE_8665_length_944_cov_1.620118_1_plen_49_part_10